MISREDLKRVAHLSQERAAAALNVGNTRFKSACRQLGVRSWPYRRIKSVRNLKSTLLDNMDSSPESAVVGDLLQMLDGYENALFANPTEPLDPTFKTMRQAAYKKKHGKKTCPQDDHGSEEDPPTPNAGNEGARGARRSGRLSAETDTPDDSAGSHLRGTSTKRSLEATPDSQLGEPHPGWARKRQRLHQEGPWKRASPLREKDSPGPTHGPPRSPPDDAWPPRTRRELFPCLLDDSSEARSSSASGSNSPPSPGRVGQHVGLSRHPSICGELPRPPSVLGGPPHPLSARDEPPLPPLSHDRLPPPSPAQDGQRLPPTSYGEEGAFVDAPARPESPSDSATAPFACDVYAPASPFSNPSPMSDPLPLPPLSPLLDATLRSPGLWQLPAGSRGPANEQSHGRLFVAGHHCVQPSEGWR